MVDSVTRQRRSEIMGRVKGKDTTPELAIRSMVHRMGYRFRLHRRDLPGCPDLVFPSRRKVIFVHGCFWHRHPGCPMARIPKTRVEYWTSKLEANAVRDARHLEALKAKRWRALVIWECETGKIDVARRIRTFLGKAGV